MRFTSVFLFLLCLCSLFANGQEVKWEHLSSTTGDIPVPWPAVEQTAALVGDLNNDGLNDFVLTCRKQAPCAVWYQRIKKEWIGHIIDTAMITVEAGGALMILTATVTPTCFLAATGKVTRFGGGKTRIQTQTSPGSGTLLKRAAKRSTTTRR